MVKNILIATNNKHKRKKLGEIVNGFFKVVDFPESMIHSYIVRGSGCVVYGSFQNTIKTFLC